MLREHPWLGHHGTGTSVERGIAGYVIEVTL